MTITHAVFKRACDNPKELCEEIRKADAEIKRLRTRADQIHRQALEKQRLLTRVDELFAWHKGVPICRVNQTAHHPEPIDLLCPIETNTRRAHVYLNKDTRKTWGITINGRNADRTMRWAGDRSCGFDWPSRKVALDAAMEWIAKGVIPDDTRSSRKDRGVAQRSRR